MDQLISTKVPQKFRLCSQRRRNKPMMEKKRRERINKYLEEIKSILVEAGNIKPDKYQKIEKADILEMAVDYLRCVELKDNEHSKSIPNDNSNDKTPTSGCPHLQQRSPKISSDNIPELVTDNVQYLLPVTLFCLTPTSTSYALVTQGSSQYMTTSRGVCPRSDSKQIVQHVPDNTPRCIWRPW